MLKPTITLNFQIDVASWRRVRGLRSRLQKAAAATSAFLPQRLKTNMSATVLLTGNARVRQLNLDFRGMDKATNVLSFPQYAPEDLKRLPRSDQLELGDIALAYQYVVAEARRDDKILSNHITHLVVHGLLHLLGYDHIRDDEAHRMEKAEVAILKELGLPNPYTSPEDLER